MAGMSLWLGRLVHDVRNVIRNKLDTASALCLALACRAERVYAPPRTEDFLVLAAAANHTALVAWALDVAHYDVAWTIEDAKRLWGRDGIDLVGMRVRRQRVAQAAAEHGNLDILVRALAPLATGQLHDMWCRYYLACMIQYDQRAAFTCAYATWQWDMEPIMILHLALRYGACHVLEYWLEKTPDIEYTLGQRLMDQTNDAWEAIVFVRDWCAKRYPMLAAVLGDRFLWALLHSKGPDDVVLAMADQWIATHGYSLEHDVWRALLNEQRQAWFKARGLSLTTGAAHVNIGHNVITLVTNPLQHRVYYPGDVLRASLPLPDR